LPFVAGSGSIGQRSFWYLMAFFMAIAFIDRKIGALVYALYD